MGKFFAETGVDVGDTGWITDKGKFIPCDSFEHEEILEEMGLNIEDVEKIWIRITLFNAKNHLQLTGSKITKAQGRALDKWGIQKFGEKKRVTASDEFIEMYCNS